ncbi:MULTISPECIES: DMT family transporter [unclassified Streptomyces]|uniref:DMT family transporter n=1 Tax=unclassified Streptomyces TaxID=2593676 RepID=UPI00168A9CE0|nr:MULTISPECIES: DMT family transporter [unclassified Streptomyces]MBD3010765.1 DMT family transporter [Streptomyces sp. 5-10]
MNPTVIAVALALASAVAYATAAVAQERLAAGGRPDRMPRLLLRGAWWGAVGLNSTGALLHVAALRYGPLTLVQPLGALTLVAAVPLGARLAGRRVVRDEWRGVVLALLGLGALLPVTAGETPRETLSLPEAVGLAAVVLAFIGLCVRPGRGGRGTPGRRGRGTPGRGLRFATASGVASGVASALTQTLTVALADSRAPGAALVSWRTAVVAVLVAAFAVSGLLLSQSAYGSGLGAPLATLTLANPVAAAAIGIVLLDERFRGGPGGWALAAAGAAAAARGVVLLSRAPQAGAGVRGDTVVVRESAVREAAVAVRETAVRGVAVAVAEPAVRETVVRQAALETVVRQAAAREALAPGEPPREPAAVPREPVPTPP